MSRYRAGVIALVVLSVLTYFGFTKANPFANPYELEAVFDNASNLKPRSPVRIAGVDVGKVTKVEPLTGGEGAARVFMEMKEKGLPIHRDATLKIRARIFLEGNFFIDMKPGSPSAPTLDSGSTIPVTQTAAPVQFSDLLIALQSDTREDLQVFLKEYSKGLEGEGARGFNRSIRYWEPAYRNSALANDASLGREPTRDLQRVLKGQGGLARALSEDEQALKDLVTNFNTTAGAFAREDEALEAAIPALRDTLRAAQPALRSLNDSLPSLRAFARDALPGTRSSAPTLARALPFIRQARLLVRRSELRGLAAELRRQVPRLIALNETSIPVLEQSRALSACTSKVLVPFMQTPIPDVKGEDADGNSGHKARFQIQRSFVGLSGESRLSDGVGQAFHTMAVANADAVQPAPPPLTDIGGDQEFVPPPRRPDVPCETQEPPNLAAPGGAVTEFNSEGRRYGRPKFDGQKLLEAARLLEKLEPARERERQRVARATLRKLRQGK
jgi:virulence factor Mce-like protein